MSQPIQPYCIPCHGNGLESGPCIDGICDSCHETKRQARLALDPATQAAQSMPRQDGGLGSVLWDMFANTHRPA